MGDLDFQLEVDQQAAYRFTVRFDDPALAPLTTDEPPPLGTGLGPNPARLLGAAVGNCLAASLLFALTKFGNDPAPIRAVVSVAVERNDRGRLRIPRMAVRLHLGALASELRHAQRALSQFEDFCIVTQSVAPAIDVAVFVVDSAGVLLHARPHVDEGVAEAQ